jgi:hypothetical protein
VALHADAPRSDGSSAPPSGSPCASEPWSRAGGPHAARLWNPTWDIHLTVHGIEPSRRSRDDPGAASKNQVAQVAGPTPPLDTFLALILAGHHGRTAISEDFALKKRFFRFIYRRPIKLVALTPASRLPFDTRFPRGASAPNPVWSRLESQPKAVLSSSVTWRPRAAQVEQRGWHRHCTEFKDLMKKSQIALSIIALAGAITAQSVTFLGASNAQKGVMFAVDNISATPIVVTELASRFSVAGTATVEIYSVAGDFAAPVSNISDPLFWGAPIVTLPGFVHPGGAIAPTTLSNTLAIPVAAGARQSFWVTCTTATGSNIYYTTGVAQWNATIATDGIVNLIGGNGKSYPLPGTTFGGTTAGSQGRLFNGTVTYMPAGPDQYDTNTLGASLDANGVTGSAFTPANFVACETTPTTVTLNSNVPGAPFEMAYNLSSLVSLSGGGLPAGTTGILNLDIAGGLFFFNGGLAASLLPWPGVPVALPFAMPILPAPGISAQLFVISGAAPDGFELSQGINIQGVPSVPFTSAAGPTGDDAALSLTAGLALPGCTAIPAVSLYGTIYTQYHVITNGRVVMGATANTGFAPAATYLATEAPFVGCYADFNTLVGGTINLVGIPGGLQVDYTGIGYFAQAGTASTYSIILSSTTSDVTISGANIGLPTTAATDMFIGAHPGGTVGIDPVMPATYVGAGVTAAGAAGFSHGLYSADLILTPLTDAGDTLNFSYNGAGYTVSY